MAICENSLLRLLARRLGRSPHARSSSGVRLLEFLASWIAPKYWEVRNSWKAAGAGSGGCSLIAPN
jgi:hypothetical protein